MSELSVRTVRLDPMTVATFRAVAENPEPAAWSMLQAWAEPQGMFDDVSSHPVYGFNNPGPSPDRSDYGYEFWIKVSDGVESSGDVQVRDFEGGLYAVTTCALAGDPNGTVPEVWLQLLHWVQESKHEWRRTTHELEKLVNPGAEEKDIILELYLPIEPGGPT